MILKVPQQDKSLPSDVMTSVGSESLAEVNLMNDCGPEEQRSFPCRSFPKRKPEKNKIMRLTKHEDFPPLRCEDCQYETISRHDLNSHASSCAKKSSDLLRNFLPSADVNDSSNNTEGNQSPDSCNQMLKVIQQSTPVNGIQHAALETILKAQMSLSRLALNFENREELETKENNPYSLISQQLLQFQLMQLLQAQISKQADKSSSTNEASDHEEMDVSTSVQLKRNLSPQRKENDFNFLRGKSVMDEDEKLREKTPPPQAPSSSLIIHHSESPPANGLNALEMLQRTADDVLSNASKGLLTNRLIDSVGDNENRDSDIRHRCRYCGKVFSSDSALQIHIRSHTGERPFKCNICGNRFTTRGNLKVHFQRHTDRFPHIKMNHNPVPEHLDKFYPPLLQNIEDENMPIDPPTPFSLSAPPNELLRNNLPITLSQELAVKDLKERIAQSIGLENSILDLNRFSGNSIQSLIAKIESIKANKILLNETMTEYKHDSCEEQRSPSPVNAIKEEVGINGESVYLESASLQNDKTEEKLAKPSRYGPQSHSIDSLLSKKSSESGMKSRRRSGSLDNSNEIEDKYKLDNYQHTEEPFMLGNRNVRESEIDDIDADKRYGIEEKEMDSGSDTSPENEEDKSVISSNESSPIQFSHFPFLGMPMTPKLSMLHGMDISSPLHPNGIMMPPSVDPSKHPTVYSTLLPRPGSNDNSWESLIEVDQTNEKEQVEELMGKSREKPTEPNQCGICLRVLSCKSALHMHYRVHTGKRPFKCRICCRAFTTKGNLKTHMSVHRAKPLMRMFHQCTVCHKKFSNALILQQHIRLHTGEATDLSLEQIAAGEIRDMPMDIPLPLTFSPFSPNGAHSHISPRIPFPPMLLPFPMNSHQRANEKDLQGSKQCSSSTGSPRSISGSSSEHQTAEDLSVRIRDDINLEIARSTVSPMSSDYSDTDEKSGSILTDQRELITKPFRKISPLSHSLSPAVNAKSLFPSIFSAAGVSSRMMKSPLSNISSLCEPLAPRDSDTEDMTEAASGAFLSPFSFDKKLFDGPHSSILPLPASLSIPSSISHLPFQSRLGSFHLPFPSPGSLHL